jgi:hypothetical protein
LSGATFNLGVNSTSIGGGEFRQVSTRSIPGNVTASFSASQLTHFMVSPKEWNVDGLLTLALVGGVVA